MPVPEALARLAQHHGVLTSFVDAAGTTRTVAAATLTGVLQGLGVPIRDPADAAELHAAAVTAESAGADPVAVSWDGSATTLSVRLPAGAAGPEVVVTREDGGPELRWRAEPAHDPTSGRSHVTIPAGLPWGCHGVELQAGSWRARATVVSAPRRVFCDGGDRPRRGVLAPLAALHTSRSWGAGNLGDLRRLAEGIARLGGSLVATLPLLAAWLDEPCDPSPYAPVSRRFWNELHLDVAAVPELSACTEAQLVLEGLDRRLDALRRAPAVDHAEQARLQREVLTATCNWFFEHASRRRSAFDAFVSARPDVGDYAAFRAAAEVHGPDWRRWPEAVRERRREDVDWADPRVRYHAYVQWLAHEQMDSLVRSLSEADVALYLDVPVGVSGDGYDAWRERDVHASGVTVGAPPDPFFPLGQDWLFPPLHPQHSRRDGHRLFRECLRHHMRAADVVRLDHVMGLHRLYWVPRGHDADAGTYVRYPAEELYALVCLESRLNRCHVVGENLGTVPAEVGEAMAEHGLSRMHLVQYELDAEPPGVAPAPVDTVAGINTHDMATFAGYWVGLDIDGRAELGLLDDAGVEHAHEHRARQRAALEGHLASSGHAVGGGADAGAALDALLETMATWPARYTVVALDDLWLEPFPYNVPGTTEQRPNWRRRNRHRLEEALAMPEFVDRIQRLLHPGPPGGDGFISADDVHLFNEGSHFDLHDKLGAHPATVDGVDGTRFAVWAPNAKGVFVVGDFNDWSPGRARLEPVQSSGIWAGFFPGVGPGDTYKFRIVARDGTTTDKADPFAFRAETPPATASVVWDLSYEWHDAEWMAARGGRNALDAPMSIYEVHLGSWRRVPEEGDRPLTYLELAEPLADYVTEAGYTHVELMPVMEHPFGGSWGYQVTGYFSPTGRHGTPQDLMALIDHLHGRGIGVILDWVPSHFPSDAHGLVYFDGSHLFEHTDPKEGFHPDWESQIFNYGRHEVASFLISSAMFWLERYHVDGLRVDAVASMLYRDYSRAEGEWVPNEYGGRENLEAMRFLRRLNEEVYRRHPDCQTIAEESTAWPMVSRPTYLGGLGFGLKWDMGWMHDTLQYFGREPVHRKYHHHELTFRMIYAFNENFVLSLSHDEVVHGKGSLLAKMPGDDWQKFANLRLLFGFMHGMPGKKLLFMGDDIAQRDEWDHERSLDWHLLGYEPHRGVKEWVAHLNRLHRGEPALHELDFDPAGFEWVDAGDESQSVISFLRTGRDRSGTILVVCNFTPIARHNYRVGVPTHGFWREIANGDATEYGGSGQGNLGGVESVPARCHGRPASVVLTLPPLAAVFLKPDPAVPDPAMQEDRR